MARQRWFPRYLVDHFPSAWERSQLTPETPVPVVDGSAKQSPGENMFKHEPCECPPNTCLKQVDPAEDCINRLTGTVEAVRCETCNGETVHHNGECLRCQRLAASRKEVAVTVTPTPSSPSPKVTPVPGANTLTLSITLGDGAFVVSDKRRVAKILKIMLEDQ